jgi:hypothetical protein
MAPIFKMSTVLVKTDSGSNKRFSAFVISYFQCMAYHERITEPVLVHCEDRSVITFFTTISKPIHMTFKH